MNAPKRRDMAKTAIVQIFGGVQATAFVGFHVCVKEGRLKHRTLDPEPEP